ncbi:TPA: xylulokinase [Clostridioides difficile]|uniref:xylulokinase n=1 Tax=Clostridioides difficile TaxID=1496 RepID=UPI001C2947E9|nr:xylulokinase [Clostridioides difficile]HBH3641826.1 xylulokinase [Clostridioides difficile]
MKLEYVLGVDIGTSGTKTVLFDKLGNTIKSCTYEYPLIQEKSGWAEQDANDWWKAVVESIREVVQSSNVSSECIKGIGLSGQMHGLVMLDNEGKTLRNSIIWCDQRTVKECEEITDLVGEERLIEITANPALTGFTASKILWVRNNEPDIYKNTNKILLPKDYIRYKLTGEYATEVSDASGMQLLDIRKRDWSDEVLEKLNIDKNLLGKVYESQEITGYVTRDVASLTGLKEGTIVVGGAGDQAAGAIGNGIVKDGVVSSTIGTSGVVFAYTKEPKIDKEGRVHTFCHAIPNTWHVMGVTQGAGLSLKWFKDNFCQSEVEVSNSLGEDVYEIINNQVSQVPTGCNGLIYLPYMMGERTPHLDPYARGVFFGLSPIHSKKEIARSIMEGVSYSLKDCMDIIENLNIDVNEVRASGGGGKSKVWRQMQADMFNQDVYTINSSEGPALGVAILALVGSGIYENIQKACDAIIKTSTKLEPISENVDTYKIYHRLYKRIYKSLKDDFRLLDEVVNSKNK